MRYSKILFFMALAIVLVFAGCSRVGERSNPITTDNGSTPASVDLMVVQALDSLATIDSEESALALIHSYPQEVQERIMEELDCGGGEQEPQSNHPAALAVINEFGILPKDIIAVQMMVWSPDSPVADTVFAVVTNEKWYYVNPYDQSIRKQSARKASVALTTVVDVYGYYVENVGSWWLCQKSEWVVDFLLPVCFHYVSPGVFDGILDAWAPNPPCGQYNGGWCAGWQCGSAWDSAGNQEWVNFGDCSATWSRKVGRLVQKRWIYTWRNAGRSDTQIANSVRARIRY